MQFSLNMQFNRKHERFFANLYVISDYVINNDYLILEEFLGANEKIAYGNLLSVGRKKEYLFGRYAAKKSALTHLSAGNIQEIETLSGIFNHPILRLPKNTDNISVSISHSAQMIIAITFSEKHPVSVDTEILSLENTNKINNVILQEEKDILSSLNISKEIGYTLLWSSKESLSKIIRTGFTLPLETMEINNIYREKGFYYCEFKLFIQYKTVSWIINNNLITVCMPNRSNLDYQSFEREIESCAIYEI
ncbi:4'-phosphopantetheinyl transferase family protein [Sporosarcina psychrophila]|uniref:Phosphopantetheinyl transferase (Holo-ACP synthase) n=1 Tax=Sporosarcina psychrophila TaxID=1476 RepID=A0ABV2KAG2_SPOPS